MTDRSYFISAKSNLEKIKVINTYVDEVTRHFFPITTGCNNLIKLNYRANSILNQIESEESASNLDRYLAFWIYEISHSPIDNIYYYNGLLSKLNALRKELNQKPRTENLQFNHEPIIGLLKEHDTIRNNYHLEEDAVVILTAIPEEFKAVLRKISIIVNVLNRAETEKYIDPESDPEKLKKREKTWVEGVIYRDNKSVKVRLVLTEEYGSVSSYDSLSHITEDYFFKNEILVVGVAGHLDKTETAKIGDLVISDSYYKAYPKDIQVNNEADKSILNTVSYDDKELKPLSNEYNVEGKFDYATWQPTKMIVKRPVVKDESRESKSPSVHKGSIVSGPSVVKQDFRKTVLQDNFEKALAIEMEAHGCYSFAKNHINLKLKVIKGICDWADHKKEKSWQPFCADLAAEFSVDYLIAKYGKDIT